MKPRLAPWTCSWSAGGVVRTTHAEPEARRSKDRGALTRSRDRLRRRRPKLSLQPVRLTVESASVIAIQLRDTSNGLEAAKRVGPRRLELDRRIGPGREHVSTVPVGDLDGRVGELSATTVRVATTPVLSRRWATAARTDVRHRPISSASLCAGITTCTANGVGTVMRQRPARRCPRTARAPRSLVRCGAPVPAAGLPSRAACTCPPLSTHPTTGWLQWHSSRTPSGVRDSRILSMSRRGHAAQEVADLGDHDQVEEPSGQSSGHLRETLLHLATGRVNGEAWRATQRPRGSSRVRPGRRSAV